MTGIVDIRSAPRRRLSKPHGDIIAAELRTYLPILDKIVDEWKERPLSYPFEDVERASQQMKDCVRAFIQSSGKWSGHWPEMATPEKPQSVLSGLYLYICWKMLPFMERTFLKPCLDGMSGAANDNRTLGPRPDFATWTRLMEFLEEVADEESRQSGESIDPMDDLLMNIV